MEEFNLTRNQNINERSKVEQLETFRSYDKDEKLTTNQGLRVSEDEHSLKAGIRGPTLLEDFHSTRKNHPF